MKKTIDGAPDRSRTGDPLLRRQLLYPTELQAPLNPMRPHKSPLENNSRQPCFILLISKKLIRLLDVISRGGEIRTHGPLVPNQVRYRCATPRLMTSLVFHSTINPI